MKHHCRILCIGAVMLLAASCSTTTVAPYDYGYAVGGVAYLGYERVAARQDDEFRGESAALWEKVDAIEDPAQIPAVVVELSDLVESNSLSDADRAALKALARLILSRADLSAKLSPEAVEFLKGVRDGVDAMRTIQ